MMLDMFKKKETYFVIDDFLENPNKAFNFFDVLTNYGKCWEFLNWDYNNSPKIEEMGDWV